MRKILCISLFVWLALAGVDNSVGVTFTELDRDLMALLNDETKPFFPDSVRRRFLRAGIKKVSATNRAYQHKLEVPLAANASSIAFSDLAEYGTWEIVGVRKKNTERSLLKISGKDVGQKRISTTEPLQYYYDMQIPGESGHTKLFLYPPSSIADTLISYTCATTEIARHIQPAYRNLIVSYALYLCRLREGERPIAEFLKIIFDTDLMDLKVLLDNRQTDITLEKKVIAR